MLFGAFFPNKSIYTLLVKLAILLCFPWFWVKQSIILIRRNNKFFFFPHGGWLFFLSLYLIIIKLMIANVLFNLFPFYTISSRMQIPFLMELSKEIIGQIHPHWTKRTACLFFFCIFIPFFCFLVYFQKYYWIEYLAVRDNRRHWSWE